MIPRRYERLKQVLRKRQSDLTVITEDVHKPHNFSAIIRTCDAVGVFEVHSVNSNSKMPTYSPVAKGSDKWVNLHTHPDLKTAIAQLQQKDLKIYAAHLSEKAVDYRRIDYTKPTAILMGAEKHGVSELAADLVDGHIIIPMFGMVESLNVSVAAAVILFEAQRQRLAAGMYDRVSLDTKTLERVIFEWGYPEIAAMYRQRGEPYPSLKEDGSI
ncbi:tRNA (Guanosine-2'-O-)-methyltransferase [Hyella patelloides LEGE 07179]|uniref:tRNA (guanosine(18)-2'-O)-methyltransferase n=1 Tax=Hyella patelloides LEGE 07179 TaxID=945734 RepID=A0A563VY28_9CYAN|nr:tRNA (guanosine(18)-2'-O)-methyltransferase TrmH [Hyella patelloides]VEP16183.1 tRNA (Guanosine-2'-O-)-methyltransferase [Hyella patelloides LEGE 07179]